MLKMLKNESAYKIVNRTFGSYAYWPDSLEEAEELLKILTKQFDDPHYIKEITCTFMTL